MLPSSRRLENGLAGCTSRCLQVDNPGAYQHLWQVPRLRHGANLLEEELLRFYDEQSERILEEFLRNLWWNSKSGLTGPRHPRHFFTCLAASSLSKKIVGLMNHCLVEYQQCFRCVLVIPVVEELKHIRLDSGQCFEFWVYDEETDLVS